MTQKDAVEKDLANGEPGKLSCGLIMPISSIDGCSPEHWLEVKNIVIDAVASITDFDFSVSLVSDQQDVGVIQKRIVQNIYNSDIVICDVSCKNPNVMFELGMRLAFDKPTIIIKDDITDYSFDTGVIEHLNYPRDLRFSKVVAFKQGLADKLCATYKAYLADSSHSFLSSFGTFKVAALKQTEGTPDQLLMEMIQDLSKEVSRIGSRVASKTFSFGKSSPTISVALDEVLGSNLTNEVTFVLLGSSNSIQEFTSAAASLVGGTVRTKMSSIKGEVEYHVTVQGVGPDALSRLKALAITSDIFIKDIRIE